MEMIKISEVIRGKRKIIFESGWTVWLDRRLMPDFPLDPGTEVDRSAFEKFILLHQYPSALNDAVALLAVRNRSRLEIRQSLSRRKYDEAVIDMVLFKLEKEKLLNDGEFTIQWVQSRINKYGPIRIAQELQMKGIDRGMSGSVIEEILTEDQELENAVLLALKKLRTEKAETGQMKCFQHVTSFLVRRGYSWGTARKAYEIALERNREEDAEQ